MMVLGANDGSGIIHYVAGAHPGKVGYLTQPTKWKNPPRYMPWALDNGCFSNWREDLFLSCLQKAKYFHPPLWVVVPDVVGDHIKTLELFHKWKERIPFRLAFACQDGCSPTEVPKEAHCCFIGGSTEWKFNNAAKFKGIAPWLHIGRINSISRILWAETIGADSVDGTGFFRDPNRKRKEDLIKYWLGESDKWLF